MTRSYTVVFDRIGRKHDVAPLVVEADDLDDLAEHIFRYARPHLLSHDVAVIVDSPGNNVGLPRQDVGKGFISCGWHNGGHFTITSEVLP